MGHIEQFPRDPERTAYDNFQPSIYNSKIYLNVCMFLICKNYKKIYGNIIFHIVLVLIGFCFSLPLHYLLSSRKMHKCLTQHNYVYTFLPLVIRALIIFTIWTTVYLCDSELFKSVSFSQVSTIFLQINQKSLGNCILKIEIRTVKSILRLAFWCLLQSMLLCVCLIYIQQYLSANSNHTPK